MEYKNQHWIPKAYLKAWCDASHRDKVVHFYGTDGNYQGWRPYSRIFSSDDLYTVDDGGRRDVQTENAFKVIEDHFLKVRNAIVRGKPLPPATKKILAWFVAATRNRSPSARDHWQSFKDQVVEVGDGMAKALAQASPSKRQGMVRASLIGARNRSSPMTLEEARLDATEPFGRWVLRHVSIEAQFLEKMSFVIMKAPDGTGFITSDNPVVWHDSSPPPKGRRRLGLRYPDIEVSLPLTPQYCVIFDHFGKDGTCDVGDATVLDLNSRTLHHSDNHFIANSDRLVVDWIKVASD